MWQSWWREVTVCPRLCQGRSCKREMEEAGRSRRRAGGEEVKTIICCIKISENVDNHMQIRNYLMKYVLKEKEN